jgi:hypothetical protein
MAISTGLPSYQRVMELRLGNLKILNGLEVYNIWVALGVWGERDPLNRFILILTIAFYIQMEHCIFMDDSQI